MESIAGFVQKTMWGCLEAPSRTTPAITTSTSVAAEPTTTTTITSTTVHHPCSALAVTHNPGDIVLKVESVDGFALGDVLRIGSMELSELRRIVGFSSILLDRPLNYIHLPGTAISKASQEIAEAWNILRLAHWRMSRSPPQQSGPSLPSHQTPENEKMQRVRLRTWCSGWHGSIIGPTGKQ